MTVAIFLYWYPSIGSFILRSIIGCSHCMVSCPPEFICFGRARRFIPVAKTAYINECRLRHWRIYACRRTSFVHKFPDSFMRRLSRMSVRWLLGRTI